MVKKRRKRTDYGNPVLKWFLDQTSKGFSDIKKLSESALISEKLLGLNMLLFVILFAILISGFFNGAEEVYSLSFAFIFALSVLFSLIASRVYVRILEVIAGFAKNKIKSLRLGMIVLFIGIPIAVAGLVYQVKILTQLAPIVFIVIQFVVVLSGAVFQFSKDVEIDKQIKPGQFRALMHDVAAIVGILSFIITIVLPFLRHIL